MFNKKAANSRRHYTTLHVISLVEMFPLSDSFEGDKIKILGSSRDVPVSSLHFRSRNPYVLSESPPLLLIYSSSYVLLPHIAMQTGL